MRESTPQQVLISHCRECGAKWFGAIACHCSQCHQTFSKIEAFDAHFEPSDYDDRGSCQACNLSEMMCRLTGCNQFTAPIIKIQCMPAEYLESHGFAKIPMNIWTKN